MKQFVKTSEIKRKIEKLVDSANKDFNNGFTDLYDLKKSMYQKYCFPTWKTWYVNQKHGKTKCFV